MFEIPGVYSVTYKDARPCLMPLASDIINEPVSQFIAQGIDDFVNHLKEIEHN